jgi:hypothetical protein
MDMDGIFVGVQKEIIPCWVMERREHELFNLQQRNRTVE